MMVAILIYYKKFVKTLKSTGFQLNPYNPCVANSIVNNKQQAICFHVEYFKLTHKDSKVSGEFINTLRDQYDIVLKK